MVARHAETSFTIFNENTKVYLKQLLDNCWVFFLTQASHLSTGLPAAECSMSQDVFIT